MHDGPLIRTRLELPGGGRLRVTFRHATRPYRSVVDEYGPGDRVSLVTLARILNVSQRTAYNWAEAGKLETRRTARRTARGSARWERVTLAEVLRLLRERGDLDAAEARLRMLERNPQGLG